MARSEISPVDIDSGCFRKMLLQAFRDGFVDEWKKKFINIYHGNPSGLPLSSLYAIFKSIDLCDNPRGFWSRLWPTNDFHEAFFDIWIEHLLPVIRAFVVIHPKVLGTSESVIFNPLS